MLLGQVGLCGSILGPRHLDHVQANLEAMCTLEMQALFVVGHTIEFGRRTDWNVEVGIIAVDVNYAIKFKKWCHTSSSNVDLQRVFGRRSRLGWEFMIFIP